jgi:hypothetical protein
MSTEQARASGGLKDNVESGRRMESGEAGCQRLLPTRCIGVARRQKRAGNRQSKRSSKIGLCGALWAKSTRSIWRCKKRSQRHAPNLYTSTTRQQGHDLSDIYHNGLQHDKRHVRINESPPARMSQNNAIAQEEDLRPGRRPTTAHHRGRPAYLGLSWPPRDLALSWHLVGTQLRPHVIQIAVSLPR